MKKVKWLLGIGTLLCLVLTIVFRILSDGEIVEYKEVQATVISAETRHIKILNSGLDLHTVKVKYNGETYKLGNPHDSYSYKPGQIKTVYLANGKLYANVEGVQTSTLYSKAYFTFLIATFVLFIVWMVSLSKKSYK